MYRVVGYNEAELIRLLQSNHPQAFEEIYQRFAPTFLGILIQLTRDLPQAEDLLQDSFVKIWLNAHMYDPAKGRLFTWMSRIVRNSALDYLKGHRQVANRLEDVPAGVVGTESPTYHYVGLTYWVNSTLTPRQSQLVDLIYFQEYTYLEVSRELGCPIGTVKTHVRQALQRLRDSESVKYYRV